MREQALARLLLVGLFVAVAIAIVSTYSHRSQLSQEISQKRAATHQFYEKELLRIEERWQGEAAQMKARIEFSRILEDKGEGRWPRFNAFLNAQSEFSHFSNLLVLDVSGKPLFHYGPEAHKILDDPLPASSLWHYAAEAHEFYRVFRLPVWLGAEKQGTLVLLKTVNNTALNAMAAPETRLHLHFLDQILVTSIGDSEENTQPGMKEAFTTEGLQLIQTDLPWPGNGMGPTLIVQRELHTLYPIKTFLLRPLTAVFIIIVLIWLGLGRWLSHTIRRMENLEMATKEYIHAGLSTHSSEQLEAAGGQPDEISDLANAMSNLMHEIEKRNLEQKAYLETLSMLDEAVLELDCNGEILHASTGWNKLSRCDDSSGKKLYDFIHSDDRELLHAQCQAFSSGQKNCAAMRLRLDVEQGIHEPWMECRFVCFHDESGNLAGVRGVLRDITQTHQHEKQLTHMALHDTLTGLPNRMLLEDRIKISLSQASRAKHKVGICFIDLDHFKNINDTLGHSTGDKLLLAFSERLQRNLREGDTVARWGGDEFVLVLPGMDSEQGIRDVALKICEEIQTPLRIENHELTVTFSMGIAMYPDDGDETETLFSQADRAMFFAKEQGRNQTCFFRDMTRKGIGKKELHIQSRLASAINSRQIQAWYQPVISAHSGLCTGAEVLARWHDSEQGWINPATFIPIAENLGLIHELGQQILLSSLDAAKRWKDAGLEISLAINVSKRQLFTHHFSELLRKEIGKHRIAPQQIILEITESLALLDVEHAATRLQELKQAGFRIAIDDFGTGYSSLSQLHEMHVDELKIDITFVRRLHESSGLSMTQAIINLARALKLKIVAEGVENAETAARLVELGVDSLQGNYFSRALPAEDFEHWLKNQPHNHSLPEFHHFDNIEIPGKKTH